MTNKEKAKEISIHGGYLSDFPHHMPSEEHGALQMAEWKDEQFEIEKQKLIDKACEWWEKEFNICSMDFQDSKDFYNKKLENFRRVMEE